MTPWDLQKSLIAEIEELLAQMQLKNAAGEDVFGVKGYEQRLPEITDDEEDQSQFLWGNYTGAYPASSDAKDIWFAVRRMFSWQGNNFIQTYFDEVDDPMNNVLVQSVVDSENIRCSAYAPKYWAGASIEYKSDDNPKTAILAGTMKFRQHIAPYTPAQEIVDIIDYDTDTLAAAVGGN